METCEDAMTERDRDRFLLSTTDLDVAYGRLYDMRFKSQEVVDFMERLRGLKADMLGWFLKQPD